MPFNFPFFRSQSNSLKNKKDSLQQDAVEGVTRRLSYEQTEQAKQEAKAKKSKFEFMQTQESFTASEIDRRQSELEKLDAEERTIRLQINKLISTDYTDPRKITQGLEKVDGLQKKIEKIQSVQRHYTSEIHTLEEQNEKVEKQIQKTH